MRAMTPSPMRTMAAKCFARVGFVMNILGKRGLGGVPLYVGFAVAAGFVVARAKCGGPSATPQDDGEKQAMTAYA
jgi:hypothetical protein